jgi:hypothetical protein
MKRAPALRLVLLLLAFVHTFPLRKHGALFAGAPSVGEGWKALGALLAVAICCLPIRWYARGVGHLVRRRLAFLLASGVLVAAHLVPASDHLPRFFVHPTWGDCWRGTLSALAIGWFVAPLDVQARIVQALRRGWGPKEILLVSRLPIVAMIGAVFVGGVVAGAVHVGRSHAAAMPRASIPSLPKPARLRVPHVRGDIMLDGELDEPSWDLAARTGGFLRGDGSQARPYSEARVTWGDGKLYVALYAADEDIRREDTFQLFFDGPRGEHGLDVGADGRMSTRLSRWRSMPALAKDADGTIDDPSDDDEEWLLEMAIPLEELGLEGKPGEQLSFAVRRCDTPKGGRRMCGAWGGDVAGLLVLE